MNSLAIDEEGFPLINEHRLKEDEGGRYIISSIERNPAGFFQVSGMGLGASGTVALEPFNAPLVIRHVKSEDETLIAVLPYDIEIPLKLNTLWVDEWDRFHGHGEGGIPFVFSRQAQVDFFDMLDEFDDDHLVWQGEKFTIRTKADILSHAMKQSIRNEGIHSALIDMMPRLKLAKCRILCVLAPGEENISQFFSKDGHLTHVRNIQSVADLRKTNEKEEYDFIYVSRDVVRIFASELKIFFKGLKGLLSLQGNLFVVADVEEVHHQGTLRVPETTEWEIREALKKDFDFLFWGRWKKSPEPWNYRELFLYAQKKRVV